MNEHILHVRVGQPLSDSLANAASMMDALERNEAVTPYFGIGFAEIGTMLGVLTPKRWDLIAVLREHGAMSVAELARRSERNYKNVHQDVAMLLEWHILERNAQGQIHAPFDELVLDVKMPVMRAA
jgi:predicted transcriptional regulator